MIKCKYCNEMIDENSTICPVCGEALQETTKISCPYCNELIDSGLTDCPICGEKLSDGATNKSVSIKSNAFSTINLVLWLLILVATVCQAVFTYQLYKYVNH